MEYKELIRARYSCKAYDSRRQLSPERVATIPVFCRDVPERTVTFNVIGI